jgi:hypothetical protein
MQKLDTRSNPLAFSVRGAFDLNQSPSACHCFRVCLIILSNIESHTSQAGELRGRSVAPPYLTEMELKSEYEVVVR